MKTLCLLFAAGGFVSATPGAAAPVPEVPRAEKPAFKGMELYSWTDAETKEWRYALLPGTNRNKTAAQITAPKTMIKSLEELKKRLSALAEGDYVFWNPRMDGKVFALPDGKVVEEIKTLCVSEKLKLSLPEKKQKE